METFEEEQARKKREGFQVDVGSSFGTKTLRGTDSQGKVVATASSTNPFEREREAAISAGRQNIEQEFQSRLAGREATSADFEERDRQLQGDVSRVDRELGTAQERRGKVFLQPEQTGSNVPATQVFDVKSAREALRQARVSAKLDKPIPTQQEIDQRIGSLYRELHSDNPLPGQKPIQNPVAAGKMLRLKAAERMMNEKRGFVSAGEDMAGATGRRREIAEEPFRLTPQRTESLVTDMAKAMNGDKPSQVIMPHEMEAIRGDISDTAEGSKIMKSWDTAKTLADNKINKEVDKWQSTADMQTFLNEATKDPMVGEYIRKRVAQRVGKNTLARFERAEARMSAEQKEANKLIIADQKRDKETNLYIDNNPKLVVKLDPKKVKEALFDFSTGKRREDEDTKKRLDKLRYNALIASKEGRKAEGTLKLAREGDEDAMKAAESLGYTKGDIKPEGVKVEEVAGEFVQSVDDEELAEFTDRVQTDIDREVGLEEAVKNVVDEAGLEGDQAIQTRNLLRAAIADNNNASLPARTIAAQATIDAKTASILLGYADTVAERTDMDEPAELRASTKLAAQSGADFNANPEQDVEPLAAKIMREDLDSKGTPDEVKDLLNTYIDDLLNDDRAEVPVEIEELFDSTVDLIESHAARTLLAQVQAETKAVVEQTQVQAEQERITKEASDSEQYVVFDLDDPTKVAAQFDKDLEGKQVMARWNSANTKRQKELVLESVSELDAMNDGLVRVQIVEPLATIEGSVTEQAGEGFQVRRFDDFILPETIYDWREYEDYINTHYRDNAESRYDLISKLRTGEQAWINKELTNLNWDQSAIDDLQSLSLRDQVSQLAAEKGITDKIRSALGYTIPPLALFQTLEAMGVIGEKAQPDASQLIRRTGEEAGGPIRARGPISKERTPLNPELAIKPTKTPEGENLIRVRSPNGDIGRVPESKIPTLTEGWTVIKEGE